MSHLLVFLPAGKTPPSGLWSSESVEPRALTDGWCRPCGGAETALWACRSCRRKHRTHFSFQAPNTGFIFQACGVFKNQPTAFIRQGLGENLLNWHPVGLTVPVAADRPSCLWPGEGGRTCPWPGPSQLPASAAPWKQARTRTLIVDLGGTRGANIHGRVRKGDIRVSTLFQIWLMGFACSHGNAGSCKSRFLFAVVPSPKRYSHLAYLCVLHRTFMRMMQRRDCGAERDMATNGA